MTAALPQSAPAGRLWRLKPFDFLFVALAVAVIALFSALVYARGGGDPVVVIQTQEARWVYPLADARELAVSGPVGRTTIVLRHGYTWVHDSDCRDKLCIKIGRVGRPGQWLACLPNGVFVRIDGRREDQETDAGVF